MDTHTKEPLAEILSTNPDLHPPDDTDERAWLETVFMMAAQAMSQMSPPSEHWHDVDLTMPQVKLLMTLNDSGLMRMGAIAEALDMRISTATGIVDRLVERKLVQRVEDPDDRRAVVVGTTDEGRAFIKNLMVSNQHFMSKVVAHLTTDELRLVARGMMIIQRTAREVESDFRR